MQTTRQLLEVVKQRHGLPTDYQLAKFLGISRQRISNNMRGQTMSDETALLVAEALGLPGEHVMAIVATERAKSEAVKKAWQRAAAATAVIVLALLGAEHGAQLVTSDLAIGSIPTLYIMSNVVLFLATLAVTLILLRPDHKKS